MQARDWAALKVLLNRFQKGSPDAFLKSISSDNAKKVISQEIRSGDLAPILTLPYEKIGRIHYSWISPLIPHFPAPLDSLVLDALPDQLAGSLRQHLHRKRVYGPFPEPVKQYLVGLLYEKLDNRTVLPVPYLPESTLNVLTEYSKAELVQLCDYLALQDLAESIRSIVDRKKLNSIFQWLSPAKKRYLKICLHQRDKLHMVKLELDKVGYNQEKLGSLLHKRGLLRFAKTLCGQHPDLVWTLTHILDTGRAAVINQYYTQESIPNITPALISQLINLMNFLKQKNET